MTPSRDLPTPGCALAIGAHPDDIEFGCGATLAKWAAAGCTVHHVVCTDGSKGTWDPDTDQAELVATRQAEQRSAADALGADGEILFLGWVDGEVEPSRHAIGEVAREIRRLQPDVLLTHDPWKRYRLHPDHRNVGWITLDAVVGAREPHAFGEHGLAHHRPSALLLFEADEPDHVETATGFVEAKLAALMEHRSQFRSTMSIDDPQDEAQVAAFRERVLDRLAEHGALARISEGEAFKLVTEGL